MIASYPPILEMSIVFNIYPRYKIFNTMTCCYKTSSLQAFIPIPELCGNVAKVKSTFFQHLHYLQFFSPPMLVQLRARSRPTFMSILRIAIQKGLNDMMTSTLYALNLINSNKKLRTFSVHARYQLFAQMLSRPDNTVPNWQKVRAVHLNMKVSCFFSTNQGFFVSSESEPSKVGYKSHPNSL